MEDNKEKIKRLLDQGSLSFDSKDFNKAIFYFTKAIELDSNDAKVYSERGTAYANMDKFDEAIDDYTKFIELNIDFNNTESVDLETRDGIKFFLNSYFNYVNVYYNRGRAYFDTKKFKKAIADFTKVIELDPNHVKAYNNRGRVYADTKKLEEAIADFTKVIELDPNHTKAYYNRGIVYDDIKKFDKAINDYDKVIELDHNNAHAYNNQGVVYHKIKNLKKARINFSKAIELDPRYVDAYINRGAVFRDTKRFNEAIADFTEVIKIAPSFFVAHSNRGAVYTDIQKFDEAIADCTRAIELNPNYADAYNNRGNAYDYKQNFKKAIFDYDKAIELNPNYADAYYNRGISHHNSQKFKKAIADFTKAIKLVPSYVSAYNNRGAVYMDIKIFDEAISDCTRAIELNPSYSGAYNNRGSIYYNIQEFEKAILDYTKSIELDIDNATAYNNRGAVYTDIKKFDEAIADCTRAIELSPNYLSAYYVRGVAYYYNDEHKKALCDFNKSLEIDSFYLDSLSFIRINFLSSPMEEKYLYANRIDYLVFNIESLGLWRKGVKNINSYLEIEGINSSLEDDYQQFAYRLQDKLEEGKGDFSEEKQLKYQVLYLIYFLLGMPYRTFEVIDQKIDSSEFEKLSPMDHYFFVQSAWRIIETRDSVKYLLKDAQDGLKDEGELPSYENIFKDFILKTNLDEVDVKFSPSRFYPYYNNFVWEIDKNDLLGVLEKEEGLYGIGSMDINWIALLNRLLTAYARGEKIESVFSINKKFLTELSIDNFGTEILKAIKGYSDSSKDKLRKRKAYKKILEAPVANCGAQIIESLKNEKDLGAMMVVFCDRYLSSTINKKELNLLVFYSFAYYAFLEKNEEREFNKEVAITGIEIAGLFLDFFSNSISLSVGLFVSQKTISKIISKVIEGDEFPVFEDFSKKIEKYLQ
ncbi:MAG: tetratricopeptide repeat protein [Sphingobacteriia bacterium]|nr:tetratricopeptide repeat protein [Sphingobacteriia bacterium]